MATVTGAQFNQYPSQVKRTAEDEPVVITEHGRPAFVLVSYAEFERLRATPVDLADWLEMTDDIEVDFAPVGLAVEPVDPDQG